MAQKRMLTALAALVGFATMVACNNEKNAPPPRTPVSQTTTTGATMSDQPNQPDQESVTGQVPLGTTGRYGAESTGNNSPARSSTINPSY